MRYISHKGIVPFDEAVQIAVEAIHEDRLKDPSSRRYLTSRSFTELRVLTGEELQERALQTLDTSLEELIEETVEYPMERENFNNESPARENLRAALARFVAEDCSIGGEGFEATGRTLVVDGYGAPPTFV